MNQREKLFEIVKDGDWYTLPELANLTGTLETGTSARLRDFRKDRYGSHTVERKHLGSNFYAYRVLVAS